MIYVIKGKVDVFKAIEEIAGICDNFRFYQYIDQIKEEIQEFIEDDFFNIDNEYTVIDTDDKTIEWVTFDLDIQIKDIKVEPIESIEK